MKLDTSESPVQSGQPPETVNLRLTVNGTIHQFEIDGRTTLLDLLRDHLHLTGTKMGCNHGQCGACTVHVDGEARLSCLTLAISQQDRHITTIEGIGSEHDLHQLQAEFIRHDAFQCGYCTSGQIMAGLALIAHGRAHDTEQIAELMSGNLCRCGCYANIAAAILDAAVDTPHLALPDGRVSRP